MSTGKALTTREIMDLPVMTNNVVLLARLAPGVVNQGTTQFLTQGMVGGGSGFFAPLSLGQNEWSIDGAPNLGSGGIAFMPFTDQIAEYKIDTTSFDASVGHSIGLSVAFSTKSGTNSLHGSATEQYWNTRWNAASFFVKQKYFQNIAAANAAGNSSLASQLRSQPMQPGGHSNDYGFTLGGPGLHSQNLQRQEQALLVLFPVAEQDSPAGPIERNHQYGPHHAAADGQLLGSAEYQFEIPDLRSAERGARCRPGPGTISGRPFRGTSFPKTEFSAPKIFDWYTSRLPIPNSPVSPGAEPFNNFLALGQADNVNYTGLAGRGDYAPDVKNRFSFSWNWSHFIENAQDWTYAS